MEEIEITYSAFGFNESTFTMEISDNLYEKLEDADLDGEYLDSDYISENKPRIHKQIIRAIRNDMEDKTLEPDEGFVEKVRKHKSKYKEYLEAADHNLMDVLTDDDDITYEIEL